jgi:hypothetical protein
MRATPAEIENHNSRMIKAHSSSIGPDLMIPATMEQKAYLAGIDEEGDEYEEEKQQY